MNSDGQSSSSSSKTPLKTDKAEPTTDLKLGGLSITPKRTPSVTGESLLDKINKSNDESFSTTPKTPTNSNLHIPLSKQLLSEAKDNQDKSEMNGNHLKEKSKVLSSPSKASPQKPSGSKDIRKMFNAPRSIHATNNTTNTKITPTTTSTTTPNTPETPHKTTIKIEDTKTKTTSPTSTSPKPTTEHSETKKNGAKQYLALAKKELEKTEYATFQTLLRSFKSEDIKLDALVEKIKELFGSQAKYAPLLTGFITFIPPKHHEKYKAILVPNIVEIKEEDESKDKIKPETDNNHKHVIVIESSNESNNNDNNNNNNTNNNNTHTSPPKRNLDIDLITGQPYHKNPRLT
eukprot:TRINITY_DN13862_c0_g1_i1.p1 TRINITY_DN13862_c0_g1~~TRINITY_DN13862_c0_g1_i1.p1  ORF type:complete len:347 (-),score=119.71 TRINITY_DN13862_c0_g1_i1:123-1163(-)